MLTELVEKDIRNRAAALFDGTMDPISYLDRHTLLVEVDALRTALDFFLRHGGEPEISIEQSGLPPYVIHVIGAMALAIQYERQTDESAVAETTQEARATAEKTAPAFGVGLNGGGADPMP